MRNTFLIISMMFLGFTACKRDEVISGENGIKTPVVDGVNRTTVQAGDTVIITGSNLQQDALTTELAINGRPATIIKLNAESITALVPVNTYSGKIMVTISNVNQFANAYGPSLTVEGTPLIRSFSPAYVFEGDTVTLVVENFSAENTDNFIALDGKRMEITFNNKKDTLKVVVPQGASTAAFTYSTYGGPVYTGLTYLVRKTNYPVNSIMEWLGKDPAFSIAHYSMTHNNSKVQVNYDTLSPYLNGIEPCAIFVSINEGYGPEMRIYSQADMLKYLGVKPYEITHRMLAAVVPGLAPPMQLTAGTFVTRLDENMVFLDPSRAHRPNKVEITKDGNDYYIQALTLWGTLGNKQKIRFIAQVGNSYLYQITGPLPYDIDF